MNEIESLFSDKQDLIEIDKIFCILEGQDELSFVKKVYELNYQEINCQEFISNKIELSWGKKAISWNNLEECKFQGGHMTGCPVPYPVLESLHNSDIEDYKAILIMFDKDRDTTNEVENQSKDILESFNNYIFISNPCFEKVAIDFIKTEEIKQYIKDNYKIQYFYNDSGEVVKYSKCDWYKNNLAKLPKSTLPQEKKIFKRAHKLDKLIGYLRLEDIEDESIELKDCISFIKSNF